MTIIQETMISVSETVSATTPVTCAGGCRSVVAESVSDQGPSSTPLPVAFTRTWYSVSSPRPVIW